MDLSQFDESGGRSMPTTPTVTGGSNMLSQKQNPTVIHFCVQILKMAQCTQKAIIVHDSG